MTTPTIRRRKWHRKTDRWQATGSEGQVVAYSIKPIPNRWVLGYWGITGGPGQYHLGPMRKPPADWTATLRRIAPS